MLYYFGNIRVLESCSFLVIKWPDGQAGLMHKTFPTLQFFMDKTTGQSSLFSLKCCRRETIADRSSSDVMIKTTRLDLKMILIWYRKAALVFSVPFFSTATFTLQEVRFFWAWTAETWRVWDLTQTRSELLSVRSMTDVAAVIKIHAPRSSRELSPSSIRGLFLFVLCCSFKSNRCTDGKSWLRTKRDRSTKLLSGAFSLKVLESEFFLLN